MGSREQYEGLSDDELGEVLRSDLNSEALIEAFRRASEQMGSDEFRNALGQVLYAPEMQRRISRLNRTSYGDALEGEIGALTTFLKIALRPESPTGKGSVLQLVDAAGWACLGVIASELATRGNTDAQRVVKTLHRRRATLVEQLGRDADPEAGDAT